MTCFTRMVSLLGGLLTAGSLMAGSFAVPFDFEASGRRMPAGRYEVQRVSAHAPVFEVRHQESGKSAMVNMPLAVQDSQWQQARIVFRCAGGECAMAEIWKAGLAGAARPVRSGGPVTFITVQP